MKRLIVIAILVAACGSGASSTPGATPGIHVPADYIASYGGKSALYAIILTASDCTALDATTKLIDAEPTGNAKVGYATAARDMALRLGC